MPLTLLLIWLSCVWTSVESIEACRNSLSGVSLVNYTLIEHRPSQLKGLTVSSAFYLQEVGHSSQRCRLLQRPAHRNLLADHPNPRLGLDHFLSSDYRHCRPQTLAQRWLALEHCPIDCLHRAVSSSDVLGSESILGGYWWDLTVIHPKPQTVSPK